MTLEMITGVRTAKTDFSNLKKIVYFKLKGFLVFFFFKFSCKMRETTFLKYISKFS